MEWLMVFVLKAILKEILVWYCYLHSSLDDVNRSVAKDTGSAGNEAEKTGKKDGHRGVVLFASHVSVLGF